MVATPAVIYRITGHLEGVMAYVQDLPGLLDQWEDLNDEGQTIEVLRWDHLMADYLTELDEHYHAGDMLATQEEQYRYLLRLLRDATPIIEKLDLMRPPVSLAPADEVA